MNLNDLFTEEKVRLDPHCWHNKKIGDPKTKVKGGVRVNNCVPKESVEESTGQPLSVQQLATISDAALDDAYHYGRSTPGNTFGWQANLKSAAYAKQMIDQGITDIEAISDAIHKGWNTTAQAFVQNPEQFDDTAKLAAAGKLEAKLQQRAQLMKQNYAQLPEEEKEKDRVVARALLQAIRGEQQQGVAEGEGGLGQVAGIGINGKQFNFSIKDLIAKAQNYPVKKLNPQLFVKQLADRHEDPKQTAARAQSADLQYPIIVVQDGNTLMIADGTHRAQKAIMNKLPAINAHVIPVKDMAEFSKQGVAEAQTDYQRRRQRERDVDAGKPVKPPPKNPQNDYFARRKKERDMAEGVMYGAENLHVGDDVIISGDVNLKGATGVIDSFGQDKRFVVVNLYNHGKHSFHSSDVSANDHDNDEHDDDVLDEKSVSQAQFRTMAAAAHNPKFARKVGISQDVAKEFHSADKHSNYKKLPDRTTEGEQQKGADYRPPKEAEYGPEYDDMVVHCHRAFTVILCSHSSW